MTPTKRLARHQAGGPALVAAALSLMLCTSCIIRSVHPWLKADALTFEEDLLGGWIGTGESSKTAMTFARGESANVYTVQYSSGDQQGTFEGRVAKFGGDYYLDFRPLNGAPGVDGMLLCRTHSIARLELGGSNLVIYTPGGRDLPVGRRERAGLRVADRGDAALPAEPGARLEALRPADPPDAQEVGARHAVPRTGSAFSVGCCGRAGGCP
jgi:hypothetical protein